MNRTKIEWCDYTWNPITGCTKGCTWCYARALYQRFGWSFKPTYHPDRLMQPVHTKTPSRIFTCSVGDMFDPLVNIEDIDNVLEVMMACPQHTFIVLTKRPENLESKLYGNTPEHPCRALGGGDFVSNLWLGVSVTNQKDADDRIPPLFEIPVAKRFVSVEPMLESVGLMDYLKEPWMPDRIVRPGSVPVEYMPVIGLDWVIIGGLTGPKEQPPKREWVDALVSQCDIAHVPVFIKDNAKYPGERKNFP
jgi:protein gp37